MQEAAFKPVFHLRIWSREANFSLTRMRGHKIRKPFALVKKGVRMIPILSHFFAAKKVATKVDFKIATQ
jgi:hypothetical protein